jgi:hypothetical protein
MLPYPRKKGSRATLFYTPNRGLFPDALPSVTLGGATPDWMLSMMCTNVVSQLVRLWLVTIIPARAWRPFGSKSALESHPLGEEP